MTACTHSTVILGIRNVRRHIMPRAEYFRWFLRKVYKSKSLVIADGILGSVQTDVDHEASPPSPPPSQLLYGSVQTDVDHEASPPSQLLFGSVHVDVDHEASPPPSQLLCGSVHADVDHEASPPPSLLFFASAHTDVDSAVSDVFRRIIQVLNVPWQCIRLPYRLPLDSSVLLLFFLSLSAFLTPSAVSSEAAIRALWLLFLRVVLEGPGSSGSI